MANSGWTNDIPNPLIVGGNGQTGQIILLAADGVTEAGTLDGDQGLVFAGQDGSLPDNPSFELTPLGDVIWLNFAPNQTLATSIEIGTLITGVLAMTLGSGEINGQAMALLSIASASSDGSQPPMIIASCPVVATLPGSDKTPEVFHTLPLVNGWVVPAGGVDQPPQYKLLATNMVRIRGIMSGGSSVNFATLPTGYVPPKTIVVPVAAGSGVTAGASAQCVIRGANTATPGLMSLSAVTAGAQVGLEFDFSIDP